jgi:hypothetical protein
MTRGRTRSETTAGRPVEEARAPSGAPAYLYGIVRWPTPWAKSSDEVSSEVGTGVGDPPAKVVAVPDGALAALLSAVDPRTIGSEQGVRGLRRDMRAHANVLNKVVALGGTVLPAAFGLIFPQGNLLAERFLRPRHRVLDAQLTRLDDAVEVTLKVMYVEGQALAEVVAESPRLAQAGGRGLESKIELGKRVANALRAKRDRDAQAILTALSPAARDAKLNDNGDRPGTELTVLNASLLVPRKTLPKFDQALAQLNRASTGRLQFDCVGPLPPYSFVDLRL